MQYKMSYRQEPPARPVAKAVMKPMATVKRRHSPSQGVDPDDLTRRLLKVIADEKAYSERKKQQAEREASRQTNAGPSSTGNKDNGKEAEPSVPAPRTNIPVLQPPAARIPKENPITLHLRARPKTSGGELSRSKTTKEASQTKVKAQDNAGAAPTSPNQPYVPQNAALQFMRTATAESMSEKSLVHRLSKTALNLPDRRLSVRDPNIERSRSLRKSKSYREVAKDRGQFQKTIALEFSVEEDEETPRPQFRHTFGPEQSEDDGQRRHRRTATRRMSTGSLAADHDARRRSAAMTGESQTGHSYGGAPVVVPPETIQEHRVDWTQRDELSPQQKDSQKTRQRITPLLRKADSIWTLRGRLGSSTKTAKEERTPLHPEKRDATTAADLPRSPIAGLFAR